MGLFNVLKTEVDCSCCHNRYLAEIQFKYGSTRQFVYVIGDKLRWNGANEIGAFGKKKVKVYGILSSDFCINGCVNEINEFDILVSDNTLEYIQQMNSLRDYLENDGNFKILED